jgi:hypothetical protein
MDATRSRAFGCWLAAPTSQNVPHQQRGNATHRTAPHTHRAVLYLRPTTPTSSSVGAVSSVQLIKCPPHLLLAAQHVFSYVHRQVLHVMYHIWYSTMHNFVCIYWSLSIDSSSSRKLTARKQRCVVQSASMFRSARSFCKQHCID